MTKPSSFDRRKEPLAAGAASGFKVLASTALSAGLITLAVIQNLVLSIMRWQLSYNLFALLGLVQSISNSGRRLLIVIEEVEKKADYSDLWADLTGAIGFGYTKCVRLMLELHSGRDFTLTFESPRSNQVALFRHGERVFDHVMLFPPKSKGTSPKAQEDRHN